MSEERSAMRRAYAKAQRTKDRWTGEAGLSHPVSATEADEPDFDQVVAQQQAEEQAEYDTKAEAYFGPHESRNARGGSAIWDEGETPKRPPSHISRNDRP